MNPFRLYLIRFLLLLLPETRLFGLKRYLYRFAGVKVNRNVRICSSVTIAGNGELIIGDNTWLGPQTCIISSSSVIIGNNVDIAPRVYIGTGTHEIDITSPGIAGRGVCENIKIGNGCWLGVGSIILPGVNLDEKCVVAAGAVVNIDFGPYSLIAGIPGKLKKSLKQQNM